MPNTFRLRVQLGILPLFPNMIMGSSWMRLPLLVGVIFSTSAVLATPGRGQVSRVSPAFQLVSLTEYGEEIRYSYRLMASGRRGEIFSDVYLEIESPKGKMKPVVYGAVGTYLFDGIANNFESLDYSHPPLFIGSPAQWSAAVYLQGVVSWGATRYADGSNYGVSIGQMLEGFELRSPALPAFRRYRVVPYRPLPSEGAGASGPTLHIDSTWVLHEGVILGPGWERGQVTGEFVRAQIERACEARLLDLCGRYLRMIDDVIEAERKNNDRAFAKAVHLLQRQLASDRGSHDHARFVLTRALPALAARPPSKRALS